MAIFANRTMTNVLSPPHGWPVRLSVGQDTVIWCLVDKTITTITATAAALKTATLKMALFNAPATAGSGDGTLVVDYDTDGVTVLTSYSASLNLGTIETSLALNVPDISTHVAKAFVVKLWVESITGDASDTIIRDTGITDATLQPRVPGYVDITGMTVA